MHRRSVDQDATWTRRTVVLGLAVATSAPALAFGAGAAGGPTGAGPVHPAVPSRLLDAQLDQAIAAEIAAAPVAARDAVRRVAFRAFGATAAPSVRAAVPDAVQRAVHGRLTRG